MSKHVTFTQGVSKIVIVIILLLVAASASIAAAVILKSPSNDQDSDMNKPSEATVGTREQETLTSDARSSAKALLRNTELFYAYNGYYAQSLSELTASEDVTDNLGDLTTTTTAFSDENLPDSPNELVYCLASDGSGGQIGYWNYTSASMEILTYGAPTETCIK